MRTLFLFWMFLLSTGCICIYAEPDDEASDRMNMRVEFVSRYIWRGYSVGGSGIQASMECELFGNNSHSLEIETWGYTDFNVSTKEIDLSLSYSFLNKKAMINLFDYWYVPETTQNYLDYKNRSTSHTLELQLGYTCDLKNDNCLTFMWTTVFYGNDKKLSSAGDYKQAYSSYLEMKYKINSIFSKYGCEASAGFSPWESPTNYMVEKFSWINAELKFNRTFTLSDGVELYPSVALTINPALQDAYISLGVAASF